MKFFNKNYLARKVMILCITLFSLISLILLSVLFVQFFERIKFEQKWILEGFFDKTTTEAQKIETSFKNSQAYQLETIFTSLISIIMVMILAVFIISIIANIKLSKQTSNVNIETKISLTLLSILLVVVFVFLSLQPSDVNRSIFVKAFNQTINDVLDRMPYTLAFISYVLIVISFILNILARKQFGFLNKDKILAKNFIDTTKLQTEINQILKK